MVQGSSRTEKQWLDGSCRNFACDSEVVEQSMRVARGRLKIAYTCFKDHLRIMFHFSQVVALRSTGTGGPNRLP
jgi:hypothetical protein